MEAHTWGNTKGTQNWTGRKAVWVEGVERRVKDTVLKYISLGIPVGYCQCAWSSLFTEEHLGVTVLW